MKFDKVFERAQRGAYYLFQKSTKYGIDTQLEQKLRHEGVEYLAKTKHLGTQKAVNNFDKVLLGSLELEDRTRFSIVRDDIYQRFLVSEEGQEMDEFGRKGQWIPRGCQIYFDAATRDYVKVVDEYFCWRGEGRFLGDALKLGMYDFLCPNLSYIIEDDTGALRGYAIRAGKSLTHYEFERYVGISRQEVICKLTESTGLYFYDLSCHNMIIDEGRVSIIDLESVLPIEWFGKGIDFSLRHLSDIDIGWPIQTKWYSPRWYRNFLIELTR
jgi:hypothetical protein